MTIPTICESCGFGAEHICERSVCCCDCHETVIVRAGDGPRMSAAVQATVADLDGVEDYSGYSIAA